MATGAPRLTLASSPGKRVLTVAFDPGGHEIAAGGDDGVVRVWGASDGALQASFTGHKGAIDKLAWAPDGRSLVTASDDHTLGVWSLAFGHRLAELVGHTDEVWSLAVDPTGKYVVSGGKDATLRLWDLMTLRPVRDWKDGAKGTMALAFAPDGATFAAGHIDGTVRVWSVGTSSPSSSVLPTPPPTAPMQSPAPKTPQEATYRSAIDELEDDLGPRDHVEHAEKTLNDAVAADPKWALGYVGLARVAMKKDHLRAANDPSTAAEGLDARALALDPNLAEGHFLRAQLLMERSKLDDAHAEALVAEKLLGGSPRTDNLLGTIAIRAGDLAEGERRIRSAIASTRDPKVLVRSYAHLNEIYFKRSDYGGADRVYMELISLQPDLAWPRSNYAAFLVGRGDFDRAIALAQQAIAQMNYGAAHRVLAEAYAEKGAEALWDKKNEAAAKENFDLAVQADPTYGKAHYGLGAYWRLTALEHHDKGALERSNDEFRAAEKLDKDPTQAAHALSENEKFVASR